METDELLCAILGALLMSVAVSPATAHPYSSRIRIIVPFPAGGIADLYARLIGTRVSEAWGQPVAKASGARVE